MCFWFNQRPWLFLSWISSQVNPGGSNADADWPGILFLTGYHEVRAVLAFPYVFLARFGPFWYEMRRIVRLKRVLLKGIPVSVAFFSASKYSPSFLPIYFERPPSTKYCAAAFLEYLPIWQPSRFLWLDGWGNNSLHSTHHGDVYGNYWVFAGPIRIVLKAGGADLLKL